jgi:tRNA wybutosine-synthesizing protein 1
MLDMMEVQQLLKKQGYRMVGNHSAVKVCQWTKQRLLEGKACYKSQFYGIASHRCIQMTPSVSWCQHSCVFCWRPVEHTLGEAIDVPLDEPSMIVDGVIEGQRKLLSGYWGEERVKRGDMREAYEPKHAAISLAGEPTNYPFIDELIGEFHRRGMTTFLVTNGMNPQRLVEAEPTQLYLSLIAYDEDLYRRINVPRIKDGWIRLMESIDVIKDKRCKTVARITLVRGYNLEHPERFAKLITRLEPDFVEPKGYVHVGFSRKRLQRDDMPTFQEVYDFGRALAVETGYEIKDTSKWSKVVLLSKA